MKYVVSRVTLDLGATSSPLTLTAKQGDSVREIIVGFTNNGAVYPLENSCTVVFTAEKPSGAKIFNECTLDGNNARYKFTAQTVSEIGAMKCEFKIFDDMTKPPKLTSPRFMINVEEPVFNDGDVPESSYEFNAISDVVKKVALEYLQEHPAITDKTLTLENNAADAKAVGDEIKKLLPRSGGDITGEIRMNGNPVSGLNAPVEDTQAANKAYVDTAKAEAKSYTDTSVRKAAPVNLLDNSDFRNPVNQRGQASYSLSAWGGYCIDRWGAYADGATVTIGSGGLTLSGNILQVISSDIAAMYNGKVLTFAVKIAGTVYCCSGEVNQTGAWNPSARFDTPYGYISFETEENNDMFVIIDSSTTPSVVEWAALYEGAYTAQTLPEYHPKGYMAEALNCGALHVTTTATLEAGWWSDSAPYVQGVVISSILDSDMPHITPVYSTTNAIAIAQKEAWACVSKAVTEAGLITFTCFEDKPATAIPIQIEVNR